MLRCSCYDHWPYCSFDTFAIDFTVSFTAVIPGLLLNSDLWFQPVQICFEWLIRPDVTLCGWLSFKIQECTKYSHPAHWRSRCKRLRTSFHLSAFRVWYFWSVVDCSYVKPSAWQGAQRLQTSCFCTDDNTKTHTRLKKKVRLFNVF